MLENYLHSLLIGPGESCGDFFSLPLKTAQEKTNPPRPVESAMKTGDFSLREAGEAGDINYIQAINDGSEPVIVFNDQELPGVALRQNRLANATAIVPPRCEALLTTLCSEELRWNYHPKRPGLPYETTIAPLKIRAAKSSVHTGFPWASPTPVQQTVWKLIADMNQKNSLSSRTRALTEVLGNMPVQPFNARFPQAAGGQQGLCCFNRHGEIVALDLIPNAKLYGLLHHALCQSYLLNEPHPHCFQLTHEVTGHRVTRLLKAMLKASLTLFSSPSPEAGENFRLDGQGFIATGLMTNGQLVHLGVLCNN